MKRKRLGSGLRPFKLDVRLGGSRPALVKASRRRASGPESTHLSALDLGTTHLKAVVCQLEADRVVVLGQAVEPWAGRLQGTGNGLDPTLVEACERLLRQAEDMTEAVAGRKVVADRLVIGLPAAAVQVATSSTRYARRVADEPIDIAELERVLLSAQRAALRSLCAESGTPADLLLLGPCSRTSIAIDGHLVDDPVGLRGSVIRIDSLNARAPHALIRALEGLADQMRFDPPSVEVESQAMLIAYGNSLEAEGLGIDLGGRSTTLLLWREGMQRLSDTFPAGGRDVTAILGRACQLDEKAAERLKADYVAGEFDDGQRLWLRGILRPPLQRWADQVARRLAAWSEQSPLPSAIWLWGGGAMLRETEEAVRWATQGLPLVGFPRIQRLANVSHLGLLNRAGGTASTLCTVAHGLALAQGAGMRATPEARYLAQATREACTAERIPCWEPHDG